MKQALITYEGIKYNFVSASKEGAIKSINRYFNSSYTESDVIWLDGTGGLYPDFVVYDDLYER